MNTRKNPILFLFTLVMCMLFSSCGLSGQRTFIPEDARFATYVRAGTDSLGLEYFEDADNPGHIAVAMGSCTASNITITTYGGQPVTDIYPGGFQNCVNLTSISLPATITSFGTDAFAGSGLLSVTIPANVETISTGAFRNCRSLESVYFENGNVTKNINDYAFANDFSLSYFPFNKISNLEIIGKESFLYCKNLQSVVLPKKFLSLGEYAFQDCSGLTTIYFPASVTMISPYAFRGVGSNATIYFAENKEQAFGDLGISYNPNDSTYEGLINYMYSNTYIPIVFDVGDLIVDGPFKYIHPEDGQYNLVKCTTNSDAKKFTITETVEVTETIADDEIILLDYDDDGRTSVTIPSEVDWGDMLKVVGIYPTVFKDNTNINSVTFGPNLRFIDYQAFSGCVNLANIDLAGATDLKYIQGRAFYDCMPIVSGTPHSTLHIPPNVLKIGVDAFRSCDNLLKLFFDGATDSLTETFVYKGGTASFDLSYFPSAISKVILGGYGPAVSSQYSLNGSTITISTAMTTNTVIKVTYLTSSTTTQNFLGKTGVNSFNLSAEAVQMGSVTVDGASTPYSTSTVDGHTVVTLASAPSDGADVSISYRAEPKLTEIDKYSFSGCLDNKNVYKPYFDAYQDVYFPESLTNIADYAFASSQFVGGAHFKSTSLEIHEYAFYSQECLGEIVFPESMTNLYLYKNCFSQSDQNLFEGAYWNKKLTTIILPASTTVMGNDIFYYNFYCTIYCIDSIPSNTASNGNWNKMGNKYAGNLGDYGNAADDAFDYIPVLTVDSTSDILDLPTSENPIFTFAKQKGQTTATLGRYHNNGGFITDINGNSALSTSKPSTPQNDNSASYKNDNFSSPYAGLISNYQYNMDSHFEVVVPSKVSFDNGVTFLEVTEVADHALAIGSQKTNYTDKNDVKYWQQTYNYFTIRSVILPNSLTRIGKYAFAFNPIAWLKSYPVQNSAPDAINKSYLPTGIFTSEGYLPSSLTTLDIGAFAFTNITQAHLPNCLTNFGGITTTTIATTIKYSCFPFFGCYHLSVLEIFNAQYVANPVFQTSGGMITYKNPSNNADFFIEGAAGMSSIVINWGSQDMAVGTLRGARQITTVEFPYTMSRVNDYFIDAIGSGKSPDNNSGSNSLVTVTFGNATDYNAGSAESQAHPIPECTYIGWASFYGCRKLENFEIPISLTTIGGNSFQYCEKLDNLTVDNGEGLPNTVLGTDFDLTKTNLVDLGNGSFLGCKKFTSVTTSSRIASLGNNVFQDCTGLTEITLDQATKSIGSNVFRGCTSLVTANLNSTTTLTLNGNSFEACTNLTSVNFQNTCAVTFNSNAFKNCTSINQFTIPDGSTLNNQIFNGCTGMAYTGDSDGHGVIVGAGCKFKSVTGNSAFINMNSSTRIYLMEDAATYIAARPNGGATTRYPDGWNYYNSNSALNTYIYAATEQDKGDASLRYWHYENGVPTAY